MGTPKPRCASCHGAVVSEVSPIRCCALLTTVVMEVLPLTIPLTYFFLLPQPSSTHDQDEGDDVTELLVASSMEYARLPTDEGEGGTTGYRRSQTVALSASDKWRLVKPMIPTYMIPLCKYPFIRSRTYLLTFTSRQVCVYLVGTHLRSLSPTCSSVCFLVRIYDQPGLFFCLVSNLAPESS